MIKRIAPVLLLAAGCASADDAPTGPTGPIDRLPRPLSATEQALVTHANTFAFRLLNEVAASEAKPNVVLSPLSASFALGMLLNGAADQTWTEMRDALALEGLEQSEINAGYASLIELLVDLDPRVRFDIANSVWLREGFPFEPAFADSVRSRFDATVQTLDFAQPAALSTINGWVEDATEGRIERMIDEITPDDVLFLMNAIYFKGDWRAPFDPERTSSAAFRTASGQPVMVPMMSMEDQPLRFADMPDGTKVLEMPYGGDAYAMDFVLPPDGVPAAELAATLDPSTWQGWLAALNTVEVMVRMPRFELAYERTLNDDLRALGMQDAFIESQADFARLTPAQVYVSFVKQKSFLKVDEVGTEAAAVTGIGVRVTSLGPHIFLDRPFLFAIRERLSGAILFIGVIGDPSAGE